MNINFIDTFDKIEEYRKNNSSFDLATWKKYADYVSSSLYEKCYTNASEYNFEEDVVPVVCAALYNNFDKTIVAHRNFNLLNNHLQPKIEKLFDIDFDFDIIFYIGLCNGAGWATELDGRKVVLLGAEKIVELCWHETDMISNLVCHETAHLIHFELRRGLPQFGSFIQRDSLQDILKSYTKTIFIIRTKTVGLIFAEQISL